MLIVVVDLNSFVWQRPENETNFSLLLVSILQVKEVEEHGSLLQLNWRRY